MGHPTFHVVEEAQRGEFRLGAHVEPVRGVGGHADQVVAGAEHLIDLVVDVQAEQPLAFDEEAHFVFMVAVLVQELLAHRFLVRVGGHHVQHIDGLVAALGFYPVDIFLVKRQNLLLGGIVGNLARRCPALK